MKTLSILVPVLFITLSATAQRAQTGGGGTMANNNNEGTIAPVATLHTSMATPSTRPTPEIQQSTSIFNLGDCVLSKSGAPIMTIIKIDGTNKTCTCSWVDNTSKMGKQGNFRFGELIKANCDK
jgi:uncharacterized protein YodC (DUF2158 family)